MYFKQLCKLNYIEGFNFLCNTNSNYQYVVEENLMEFIVHNPLVEKINISLDEINYNNT